MRTIALRRLDLRSLLSSMLTEGLYFLGIRTLLQLQQAARLFASRALGRAIVEKLQTNTPMSKARLLVSRIKKILSPPSRRVRHRSSSPASKRNARRQNFRFAWPLRNRL